MQLINCLFKIIYPTSLTLGVPATLSLLSAAIQRLASKRWPDLRPDTNTNFTFVLPFDRQPFPTN